MDPTRPKSPDDLFGHNAQERPSTRTLPQSPSNLPMSPTSNMPAAPRRLPSPTAQQLEIIAHPLNAAESMQIDACAGTGKTTSLVLLARQNSRKKILYICFNNKGAQEGGRIMKECGLHHVHCSTIHGLARENKRAYEEAGKFQTRIHLREIKKTLDCSHQFAWRVQKTLDRFYNSADAAPNESHCVPTSRNSGGKIRISQADIDREVLQALRSGLLRSTQRIWEKTVDLKDPFPISFDGYLKAFTLQNPKLDYDIILLDEAQDSNELTLHLVRQQQEHAAIVLVGDPHQALYGFRGAVNAMRRWEPDQAFALTESFRFGPNIASVANLILGVFLEKTKRTQGHKPEDSVGPIPKEIPHTVVARTNATLFEEAIQAANQNQKVHFIATTEESGWDPTNPYRFNDVLDAWHLWKNERGKIRNPYFTNFASYQELSELAKGSKAGENPEGITVQGDKELEALCRLIEKHRDNLPKVLAKIMANCTSPEEAHLTLSTVHRAKGLEFPLVRMAPDFTDLVIEERSEDGKPVVGSERIAIPDKDVDREEFNILYVAATRAKCRLEPCPQIYNLLGKKELVPEDSQHLLNICISPAEEFRWETSGQSPNGQDPTTANPSKTQGSDHPTGNRNPNFQNLKIPFNEKDEAKATAAEHGGKLLWNPQSKTWRWRHPHKADLPEDLKPYLTTIA
jgi:F-box protein, helicase, 18